MEMQPIDPKTPRSVTITVQDWSMAMTLMNAGFQRLMGSMLEQLNAPPQMPVDQAASPSDTTAPPG